MTPTDLTAIVTRWHHDALGHMTTEPDGEYVAYADYLRDTAKPKLKTWTLGGRRLHVSDKHEHWWSYPHGSIQGRRDNEIAVVRYCGGCGLRQAAFTGEWRTAKGDYALDEHYDLQSQP